MKYIFYCLILFFIICEYSLAETLQLTNFHNNYNNYQNENLIEELNFAENQILQRNEKNESLLEKLEKLEMLLFGTIQSGDLGYRIGNIYANSKGYYYDSYRLNRQNGVGKMYSKPYGYYHPKYRYHPHNSAYSPYYYNNLPRQTLPKNYSVGTTVRILD